MYFSLFLNFIALLNETRQFSPRLIEAVIIGSLKFTDGSQAENLEFPAAVYLY